MNNNDVFRRLRYIFNFSDSQMIALFALAHATVTRAQISDWLKKDDDEAYQALVDSQLGLFLDGLIIHFRGKKEGIEMKPDKSINNNIVLRKIKIALTLRDEDMLEILKLVDFNISKHEISAFFRHPQQSQYRTCKDQILRNFLNGLQIKYHNKKN
jgi:uncharacterized protein YehS (DUF1456 family)